MAARAQQTSVKPPTPPPPPVGTLTGHVVASDTQRPARFAQVTLLTKEQPGYGAFGGYGNYSGPKSPSFVGASGRTDLEGNYRIANIPAGDYFLIGTLTGYVFPAANVPQDEAYSVNAEKLLAGVPVVHIVADRVATQDITLQHGATLTGRLRYEDGSPATGFDVRLKPLDAADPLASGRFPLLSSIRYPAGLTRSDDAGGYRLAGVPPGKYRVEAEVLVEGGGRFTNSAHGVGGTYREQQWLELWAPGVFATEDARIVEVRGDEVQADLDISIALSKTHRVSGTVAAKDDGHVPDHVYLTLHRAGDKDYARYANADASGAFHVDYVPAGIYTMEATNADDAEPPADFAKPYDYKVTRRYAPAKVDVVVGEHDVVADPLVLSPIVEKR